LTNLATVGGGLFIGGNLALTSLDGLSNFTSVEQLSIYENSALTNLDGLSNITSVEQLSIYENSALTNLDGLANLTSVRRLLFIRQNPTLTSFNGLFNLTNVGALRISNNDTLTNLNGLANLTSVVFGDLIIEDNESLTTLDDLYNITKVFGSLFVTGNSDLDQCSTVSRLLDQWDDAEPGPGPGVGGFPDIGGDVFLSDNLTGCNSVEEILATADPSQINSGLNDAWYNPETDGQGFFITIFPDLGYVSLAWFTYDTELPPADATSNLGDPGHRWLTAVGPIEGNQAIMVIEMTSGGLFDTATVIDRTDPPGSDGTIILTFDSCNSGTIEYDITSINRQGTVPIQRVANDNIVLCEALNSD